MPSGQADSTGLSSVGTSPSGVLKTGDSAVPGEGGAGAGDEDRRDIVLEKDRRAKEGMGLARRICGMRELSADARLRHRWQIMLSNVDDDVEMCCRLCSRWESG